MLGIPTYLWRLLPANPILLRVVSIAGKRKRDLATRCVYLGLLLGVVILSISSAGTGASTSLNDLTTKSEEIFRQMSFLQLFLVALLAPIFTAGAITQEKDSQTYDILLATPLSNAQIVLGSLCSRLFFIIALLVSGIPVFSINKIFGGVAISDIVISFAIAAATACVTGALATAIATFKVGTRRTIFSFYMLVVIYLVGIYLLDQLAFFKPMLIDPAGGPGELSTTSWLTSIHPFLALQSLFPGFRPPDVTQLPAHLRRWPIEWYFTRPATFFPAFMMLLSVILVLPSIMLLRRMAQSTSTIQGSLLKYIPIKAIHRARRIRSVWNNPIAWREAKTKASAARASFLRYGFILVGLGGAVTILFLYLSEVRQPTNYIQAGSYNPANNTLYILGPNQTYAIDPYNTPVTLDRVEAPITVLAGRYEVLAHQLNTVRGTKTIKSIDLQSISGRITRRQANEFLLGAIVVEIAVILLIVTNAAASTVTREREDGTLDLLLTTPITSRSYLWGKLAGLVSFMLPLVAVPVLSAGMFIAADLIRWGIGGDPTVQWLVLPEALLAFPALLIIVVAFATIVGMQMSLRNRTTVRAVMSSLAIVIGLMAVLAWIGHQVLQSRMGEVGAIIAAFSPLSVIAAMLYPVEYGGYAWTNAGNGPDAIFQTRVLLLVFSIIAAAAYGAVIWTLYKSMVKNFDMTIRRQSR